MALDEGDRRKPWAFPVPAVKARVFRARPKIQYGLDRHFLKKAERRKWLRPHKQ